MNDSTPSKTLWEYDGPVYYYGREISPGTTVHTMASSFAQARNNVIFKLAGGREEYNRYDIIDQQLKNLGIDAELINTFSEVKKCENCGMQLNDAGKCPKCDYGDEDAEDPVDPVDLVEDKEVADLKGQVRDALDSLIPADSDDELDPHDVIDAVLAYFDNEDALDYIRSCVCVDEADTFDESLVQEYVYEDYYDYPKYSRELYLPTASAGKVKLVIGAYTDPGYDDSNVFEINVNVDIEDKRTDFTLDSSKVYQEVGIRDGHEKLCGYYDDEDDIEGVINKIYDFFMALPQEDVDNTLLFLMDEYDVSRFQKVLQLDEVQEGLFGNKSDKELAKRMKAVINAHNNTTTSSANNSTASGKGRFKVVNQFNMVVADDFLTETEAANYVKDHGGYPKLKVVSK